LSRVGGGEPGAEPEPEERKPKRQGSSSVPQDVLLDFISRSEDDLRAALDRANELGRSGLAEAVSRARPRLAQMKADIPRSSKVDSRSIERDFDSIDRLLLEAAREAIGESELEAISKQARSQLRSHRAKMSKEIYDQTVENFTLRRLRELNLIPRLSLF